MEVLVTPIQKLDRGRGTSLIPSMAVWKNVYSRSDICNMIDFLVDNIFLKFGGVYFVKLL